MNMTFRKDCVWINQNKRSRFSTYAHHSCSTVSDVIKENTTSPWSSIHRFFSIHWTMSEPGKEMKIIL